MDLAPDPFAAAPLGVTGRTFMSTLHGAETIGMGDSEPLPLALVILPLPPVILNPIPSCHPEPHPLMSF